MTRSSSEQEAIKGFESSDVTQVILEKSVLDMVSKTD